MSDKISFLAPFFREYLDNRIVLSEFGGDDDLKTVACTVPGQDELERGDVIELHLHGWRSDGHTVSLTGHPQNIDVPLGILRRYRDRKVSVMYYVRRNGQPHGTSDTLVIEIVS